jgi:hypothetical protein
MAKWTEIENKILVDNLGKLTYKEISLILGRTKNQVAKHTIWLGKNNKTIGLKYRFHKIYSVNDYFFSEYNILSCYYAGLLAADGCIKNKNHFDLAQSGKNKILIENFVRDISYTGTIYENSPRKGEISFRVSITSSEIVKDLEEKFNITTKKSLTLVPPEISEKNLTVSFITGLIDGDGSVGLYRFKGKDKKIPIITVCGTLEIIQWVNNFVNKEFPSIRRLKRQNKCRRLTESNTYLISFSGARVVKLFLEMKKYNIPCSHKWDVIKNQIEKFGESYYLEDHCCLKGRNRNGRFVKNIL